MFGVQGERFELGTGLSPAVRAVVEPLSSLIADELLADELQEPAL